MGFSREERTEMLRNIGSKLIESEGMVMNTPERTRDDRIPTIKKIATLPKILKAAMIPHELGLQTELPSVFVRRYVEANPDINELLKKMG